MTEQQTLKVGQVVQFSGYTALEEGVTPLLNDDDRIMIMKIGADEGGNATFEVRPVDDNGTVVPAREGDMLFADEFQVLSEPEEEPAAEPEAAPAKPPRKATTKRQAAKAAAKKPETAAAKKKRVAAEKAAAKKTTAAKPETAAAKKKRLAAEKKAAAAEKAAEATTEEAPAAEETEATASPAPKAKLTAGDGYEHDPVVVALLRKSNDIVKVARDLAAQHEEIYFKLGGVLAKIHEDGMHKEAGYEDSADGFDAYVNEKIGGLGKRKAYYLIKIYRHLRSAGISAGQLKSIGWTKARALSKVPVEDMDDEWLEKARSLTRDALESEIKSTYVNAKEDGAETIRKTKYKFTLLGDANTLVEQAIDHAKKQVDDGDANKAFELICTEYLTMSQDVEGAPTLLPKDGDALVEYAAEKLGLDIMVNGPVEE